MTEQTTTPQAPAPAGGGPVTLADLAALMRQTAGVAIDPTTLADHADTAFTALDLDSLGLLGIVGELEKRHGRNLPDHAEQCKTPREFLDCVNTALTTGA
ncbi:phosphopantetheine-binding protein [Streptomyces macrosporus]|uniref:Acyl carrier protein n=1 Tax=Streptomyces macrosporus TaxID=44032 RepID=A0ABN3JEV2_9ACTN